MAKKVIWTLRSIQDRIQIYRYWEDHNQSDSYSVKLESLFNITADLILRYPEIGTTTSFPNVRVKWLSRINFFIEFYLIELKFLEFGIPTKVPKI